MNREQGVRGVQMVTWLYIRCKKLRTVFAFGAWSQIGCSPCRESARLGFCKKSREVWTNLALGAPFAWVFNSSKQFGSARCKDFGVGQIWPRLPGWLPGSCMVSPVLSLDRHLLSPVETLSLLKAKLLGNYPSKET